MQDSWQASAVPGGGRPQAWRGGVGRSPRVLVTSLVRKQVLGLEKICMRTFADRGRDCTGLTPPLEPEQADATYPLLVVLGSCLWLTLGTFFFLPPRLTRTL